MKGIRKRKRVARIKRTMCLRNPITGRSFGPCGMLILATFYSFIICFAYFYYAEKQGALSRGSFMLNSRIPQCNHPRCYVYNPTLVRRSHRERNETLEKSRQKLLVPVSVPDHRPFLLHCDTCSLVTSSGQLLGKSAGKDIDSAECVIRMNDAPIRGFERDVGRRTTVRVVGHSNFRTIFQNKLRSQYVHFRDPLTRAENVVIAWLYATNIYKNPAYRLTLNYSQMYRNVTFFMHTLAMMQHNNEVFHNETGITRTQAKTWLTTGWHAMLLALDTCDEINVYGMVYDEYCQDHPNDTTPYHYYLQEENKTRSECDYYRRSEERLNSGHLFVTEKYIFGRWAQKHHISFHYPVWKPKVYNETSLDTPFMKLYREKRVKAKKLSAADRHDENSEGENGGDRAGPKDSPSKRMPSSDDGNRWKEREPDPLEEKDFMLFGKTNMGIFGVLKR
ncbi:alpha-N-acetyl-neuraminyl-2,3-beta-galactosyl-1,3-N-acetyl-galactosaminide alpha-2,6-sialyltransferase-like [Lytechinus variegatus]|uniref:alpha-N-acetyl-neuraminyl-2,3-beta-galactosyl-1, 3-N-acetyl-galactosaminide alpha-2,6-sialyltransferase-like n=1 Tax=Lytechinus variegatus TaxID=7654 RepID=UPI001BB101EF|nr:alpha-N-acetyl-neuraminyl-2,3-beta-galactosyl-1,3-N-acetyl-galactosaminide alpha-2,6-sialyltransferase-like [Lytechinus variegatus]